MHRGVGHRVWSELFQPRPSFAAGEAGPKRNFLAVGEAIHTYFMSSLRIAFNSARRFGVVLG
jgi:hypothetical protein